MQAYARNQKTLKTEEEPHSDPNNEYIYQDDLEDDYYDEEDDGECKFVCELFQTNKRTQVIKEETTKSLT